MKTFKELAQTLTKLEEQERDESDLEKFTNAVKGIVHHINSGSAEFRTDELLQKFLQLIRNYFLTNYKGKVFVLPLQNVYSGDRLIKKIKIGDIRLLRGNRGNTEIILTDADESTDERHSDYYLDWDKEFLINLKLLLDLK